MIGPRLFEELVEAVADEAARRAVAIVRAELAALSPAASEYLTVPEAAELLRARPQRVYDLLSEGRLQRFKDGSRVLIRRADLEAYLADGVARVLPTAARSGAGSGVRR